MNNNENTNKTVILGITLKNKCSDEWYALYQKLDENGDDFQETFMRCKRQP